MQIEASQKIRQRDKDKEGNLKRSEAERLNLKYQPIQQNFMIRGYGSGEVKPLGKLEAYIEVDEAKAVTEMFVVPDQVQQIPLLIGQPFTEQRHVTIIRRRNTLRLFNEPMTNKDDEDGDDLRALNIPNLPKATVSLWAKYSVVIPPNHVGFVTLITDFEITNDLFVEAHITTARTIPRYREETIIRAEKCEENVHEDGTIMEVLDVEVRENCADRTKKILTSCDIGTELDISQREKLEALMTRPYRLGHYERLRVREQIEELKIAGIVEDSCSEYASPILIVRKKNGEERICIDYRRLNSIVKKDKYPLPLVDDQLDMLDGKRYFTSLDLKSGYYQMPLEQESRDKTAFVTPDGHYQFTRLPFGIVNGPAVFQRMINSVLGPLRFTIVMAFMDDLLIPSASIEEGLQNLEEVLKVLQKAKLTLNANKCSLFCTKVQCIRDFPEPQSIHQVRPFLGLTSYFRRLIRDHGLTAKPLTNLLRKSGMWTWGQKEQEAFDTLKRKLCETQSESQRTQRLYEEIVPVDAMKNYVVEAEDDVNDTDDDVGSITQEYEPLFEIQEEKAGQLERDEDESPQEGSSADDKEDIEYRQRGKRRGKIPSALKEYELY
ncbi:Reverse transcriptase (RNA-dependent DNA polymerase) [Popillia japonica]|uniref:RNA-directed DNA polymerase n=1 Tax=Popillia japonica TaxID=7064 RepID=A0AAW1M2D3_POPJA